MSTVLNGKPKIQTGSVPSATINGASAKSPAKLGSPSGSLAKAPPGNAAGSVGGNIRGFGGGSPDSTLINAKGGPLAKAPQSSGTSVRGFSGSGVKPGKV